MYTKHQWNCAPWHPFNYVVNLPKDYDPSKKYPLVIFLHGAGERGEDLDRASIHGFMKYVREQDKDYPFIYIAPQCPKEKYWGCYTESLLAFIDYIYEAYPVDQDRVYLTGLSMGGTGTWMLAMADPHRFAAIAPICGSGIVWNGEALAKLPTIPCTKCRYCVDGCPMELNIPMLIEIYNDLRYAPGVNSALKIEFMPEDKRPTACICCGSC